MTELHLGLTEKCRRRRVRWGLTMSGPRERARKDFLNALRTQPGVTAVLVVDAEETVDQIGDPWRHLGWDRGGAKHEQCHLMVVMTESQTAIGTLVTVSVFRTIDTGGALISFVLPFIELASASQTQSFSTFGVRTSFKGPDSFPLTGVREFYSTFALSGIASVSQPHIIPLYGAALHQALASGDQAKMKDLVAQANALTDPSAEVVSAVNELRAAITKDSA